MASTHTIAPGSQHTYGDAPQEHQATKLNVGQLGRWISGVSGGSLAIYGLLRRDWTGAGIALLGGGLIYRGITGHDYIYQALGLSTYEESPITVSSLPDKRGTRVSRILTVNRTAKDLYDFWHNVEMAPLYMEHVKTVKSTGITTSHWNATTPVGIDIEWDSEITEDLPDQVIAWRVTEGTSITGNAGRVTFTPDAAGHGTVVTLETDFEQFHGPVGTAVGQVFGHVPEKDVQETLRHFKQLMEAGEIPTTQGQPQGQSRK